MLRIAERMRHWLAPRQPAAALASTQEFDASRERAAIAETLLASAARLMNARSELETVQGICNALCGASQHIRLAWTWFGERDTQSIHPQAYAGAASAYAAQLVIHRNALTEIGPAFRTLSGDHASDYAVSRFSVFGPWREMAQQYGVRSVLAVPLRSDFSGMSGIFVVYANQNDYFKQVGEGLFLALGALFTSVLTASAERLELERAVNHDALTGVLNRHALPVVERRMARHSLFDPRSFVLLIDLDHFKQINDTHGHAVGDEVLRRTARALRDTLRREDSVMRWGGEEFLVCLHNISAEDATRVAEKLRLAIASIAEPVAVTASIGIAEVRAQQALDVAIVLADKALFAAKAAGRNRVSCEN
ncbi:MAG: GGDEF domain-containing protein [Serpentinimonas sp.]|nr:GGDEF domain-containing protein [Serpentinimonas sp.]